MFEIQGAGQQILLGFDKKELFPFNLIKEILLLFFTLVASETRWTLIMVPCSDAVAMYVPLEERAIAASGAR